MIGIDLLRLDGLTSTGYEEIDGTMIVHAVLTDEAAFDLMSLPPPEQDLVMNTVVGHGVDLSTFESAVSREAFW